MNGGTLDLQTPGDRCMTTARLSRQPLSNAVGVTLIIAVAIGGLFYVKWLPYFHKAILASTNHSIGHSILMGDAAEPPPASWKAALDYSLAYGKAIWQAMVLGLLLGAAVQEFAPRAWLARLLGGSDFRSVSIGVLMAIPGMMCTCCAAPVVIGLRRRNASAAAGAAFWLGNTVLNPATLVFMGFVLGWKWTGLRVALGIPLIFGTSYLVHRFAFVDEKKNLEKGVELSAAGYEAYAETSGTLQGWLSRFLSMTASLIPEYVLLVLILGASRAWLFPHMGIAVGNELHWIVLMSLAGLLFVIPTAGEVPIVQAMLALGVGVGPSAALLMTLAPVSLPSLVMAQRVFSLRTLLLVGASVVVAGITAGLLAVRLEF
jgi:uncharacterized membrane protein YraQ (UPF0718 family)